MSIRGRLFLWICLLFAAGFYLFVDLVLDDIQPRYLEATEEPIVDTARVLASIAAVTSFDGRVDVPLFRRAFDGVQASAFEARIYSLVKTDVDLRTYITDTRGRVIFDSDQGRDEGRDYSRWRDVAYTLRGLYGARTSESYQDPHSKTMYVAAPIEVGGELIGVLSVGKSTVNSNQFIAKAEGKLILGSIAVCLSLLAIGLLLSHWLTRPISRLTDYAQSLAAGHSSQPPRLPPGELRQLGTAFEEMRRALEGKDYVANYVQSLTHEIKSPVAAIHGAAELLAEELPAEQRHRFVDNIRIESDRIARITETLMLLTSLESRNSIDSSEPLPLEQVVNGAVTSLNPLLEARRLEIDSSALRPVQVCGDEVLVRQAVINLLQNAIDFSPPDSPIALCLTVNDATVELSVRDHGAGIPAYALEKVYDRFFSLTRPDSGKKSSGLGLSLVKEIMLLHQGSLRVANHPDGGVKATLSFPR